MQIIVNFVMYASFKHYLESLWASWHRWFVLGACFWFKALGTAVTFSYGVFLVEFKEVFNLTDAEAALPGAVQQCLRFAAGQFL